MKEVLKCKQNENRIVTSLPLLASVPPSTGEKVFMEGEVSIWKINIPGKQFQAKLLGFSMFRVPTFRFIMAILLLRVGVFVFLHI